MLSRLGLLGAVLDLVVSFLGFRVGCLVLNIVGTSLFPAPIPAPFHRLAASHRRPRHLATSTYAARLAPLRGERAIHDNPRYRLVKTRGWR